MDRYGIKTNITKCWLWNTGGSRCNSSTWKGKWWQVPRLMGAATLAWDGVSGGSCVGWALNASAEASQTANCAPGMIDMESQSPENRRIGGFIGCTEDGVRGLICVRLYLRLPNNSGRKTSTVCTERWGESWWLRVEGNLKGRKQCISGVTEFVMEIHAYNIIWKTTIKLLAPMSLPMQI